MRSFEIRMVNGQALLERGAEDTVFSMVGGGFGDSWAAASFLLRLSETTQTPTLVTGESARIFQIAPFLASSGTIRRTTRPAEILIGSPMVLAQSGYVTSLKDLQILSWAELFRQRYLTTQKTWKPNAAGIVCVHFTPANQGATVCPSFHIAAILSALASTGYRTVSLGPHLTLAQNIDVSASAELFLGIDSGLSHLVHSVGTPAHLIRNLLPLHHLRTTHRNKRYWTYKDIPEFMANSAVTFNSPAAASGRAIVT